MQIAPCTALGGSTGGLASMSSAGAPGADCPGGGLRTAWAARLAHPLLTQTRACIVRSVGRPVGASPKQCSQALTRARLKQPAAGSPGRSRLSMCPGPQASQQQHRSMQNAWQDLPQANDDSAQTLERPKSAPELSTAQGESLTHPEGSFQAAPGLKTPAGSHTTSDLQPKGHLRRPADGRSPSGRRQVAMRDRKAQAQEPERVVYVQRPHAQELPKRPGSVPDFGKLHLAWSARLAAAKAAMQRRLTVPQVIADLSSQAICCRIMACRFFWSSLNDNLTMLC